MRIRSLLAATLVLGLALPMLTPAEAQVSAGRDVTIQLSPRSTSVAAGQQIQVDLFVTNPSKKALTSVETLLSYDPAALRGVSVTYPQDTPFEMNLLSTGQSEFDATAGQIRMSRATLKDTSLLPDTNYSLATLTFEATGSGSTKIDFIKTLNGLDRVTANATVEGISTNIVNMDSLTPVTLDLGGTHSSAVTTSSGTTTTSTVSDIFGSNTNTNVVTTVSNANLNTNSINANTNMVIPVSNSNTNAFSGLTNTNTNLGLGMTNLNTNTQVKTLEAPRDVAIKKVGKTITLYWHNGDLAQGTYIYYSSEAENFKTRKRVEYPNNSFTFNGMAAKGKYYFVLTHTDAAGHESAYTPMFVVDGTKDGIYYENDSYLTMITDRGALAASNVQTLGITDKARSSLAAVPTMPQNGPAEMLLVLLLASLGGGAFLSTRHPEKSL